MVSLVALYQTRLLLVSLSLLLHTVTAQTCVNGDVRIEGTETSQMVQGIVQYCFNGVWSTVVMCTTYPAWTSNEGDVACRQLGYDRLNRVEQGCLNNSTAFVELNCPSSPVTNLQECGVMEVEGCDCGQRLVHAKVECRKEGCTNGEIRLEGGPDNREGRVEVCVNGRWGTVQTSLPRQVAEAVCNDISPGLSLFSSCLGTQFGYRQSKPVYHCDVSGGTLNCTKRDSESHNHAMDLGVVCGPPLEDKFSCTTKGESFRLTQESHIEDGVEVCVDGRWGTVCTNSQEGIAGAVCSQPELPSTGATMGTGPQVTSEPARKVYHCYSNTTCVEACCDHPTSLTVKCPTQEELDSATTEVEGTREATICDGDQQACSTRTDSTQMLDPTAVCASSQEGQFRLTSSEGRVEVCMDGRWERVCSSCQESTAALGAVTGVLMVLWLTTLTVLIGTCVVLRRECKQRVQYFKETVTNQDDQTYEEIPGPTGSTGDKTSAGHRPITNIADNPAYEAVKRDEAQRN